MVDYEKEYDVLERVFAEHSCETVRSILDVGCGTGSHALILSKRGYSVTGIDISKVMIEKANMKAEREKVEVDFFIQDMRNLNLDREFDCAPSACLGVSDTSSRLKVWPVYSQV